MASISRDPNGTKRILFTDGSGERKTIRLGKVSTKAAESFRLRVQELIVAKGLSLAPDTDTAAWLASLPDLIHERLVRAGLARPRTKAAEVTLGELLERFDSTTLVKPGTRVTYRQTYGMLRDHFSDTMPLRSITVADADNWRKAIAEPLTVTNADGERSTKRLAPATVAKRVRVAKGIFGKAVRWGMIASSPFRDLRAGSQANPDRSFYVAADVIGAVLEACPDDQWRAIVCLCRFAGLRCPSEIINLRRADVNWQRSRLTVRSPKTSGYEGHAVRMVPIDLRLREVLQRLFDAADEGVEAVVPRLRDPRLNLRTQFERIIVKAGVEPWPRLFQNLRSSCSTDWVEKFPAHAVAKWLGHSPLIAAQHYLQVRDTHFDMAAGLDPAAAEGGAKSGALPVQQAAQIAAQHPPAGVRETWPAATEEPCISGVARADATMRNAAARHSSDPDGIRTHVASVKGMCPG
ncbi:MAG: tyrosine-type recombinase/integrase, partial [Phycisphaerae bacterium]